MARSALKSYLVRPTAWFLHSTLLRRRAAASTSSVYLEELQRAWEADPASVNEFIQESTRLLCLWFRSALALESSLAHPRPTAWFLHSTLLHRRAAALVPLPVPLSRLTDSFLDSTSSVYLEKLQRAWEADPASVNEIIQESTRLLRLSSMAWFRSSGLARLALKSSLAHPHLTALFLHSTPLRRRAAALVPLSRLTDSFLDSTSSVYLEELQRAWEADPASVNEFIQESMRLLRLVRACRVNGYTKANLELFVLHEREIPDYLDLGLYGFTHEFFLGVWLISVFLSENRPISILNLLEQAYCGSIEYEFMHDCEKCNWLRERIETVKSHDHSQDRREVIVDHHIWSTQFENFLEIKWASAKRFSLKGAETLIPGMKEMFDRSADLGVESVVIGMSHRGRLNVLGNVVHKPLRQIFSKFSGGTKPVDEVGSYTGTSDVNYHLGTSYDRPTRGGKRIHLSLFANPIHLEVVDSIVVGKTSNSTDTERTNNRCVLIHEDRSFAGGKPKINKVNKFGTTAIAFNLKDYTMIAADSRAVYTFPTTNPKALIVDGDIKIFRIGSNMNGISFGDAFQNEVLIKCLREHRQLNGSASQQSFYEFLKSKELLKLLKNKGIERNCLNASIILVDNENRITKFSLCFMKDGLRKNLVQKNFFLEGSGSDFCQHFIKRYQANMSLLEGRELIRDVMTHSAVHDPYTGGSYHVCILDHNTRTFTNEEPIVLHGIREDYMELATYYNDFVIKPHRCIFSISNIWRSKFLTCIKNKDHICFISRLPWDTNEVDLLSIFKTWNPIEVLCPVGIGFGYICFGNPQDLNCAVASMKGKKIGDMRIRISKVNGKKAKRLRKTFGGGMRQDEVLCAATYVALRDNVGKLEDDHKRANFFSDGLNQIKQLTVDTTSVETNMIFFDIKESSFVSPESLSSPERTWCTCDASELYQLNVRLRDEHCEDLLSCFKEDAATYH